MAILSIFGVVQEPQSNIETTNQENIEEIVIAPESLEESEVSTDITVDLSEDEESEFSEPKEFEQPTESVESMAGTAPSIEQLTQVTNEPIVPTSELTNTTPDIRTMLVAGGCFWCVEADLEKTTGVIEAVSGYAGGSTDDPTYDDYKKNGHREVVEVTYDANVISYEEVLIITMKTTDPTDDDGTFADRGNGYSSAFYYETAEQKEIIDNLIAEVNENGPYGAPLAIDVETRPVFYKAEDFHQDYYKGSLIQQAKYQGYRAASGRTKFIEQHWGVNDHDPSLPWRTTNETSMSDSETTYPWTNYVKPDDATLQATLDPLAYRVTQQDGTERAGTSPLDKIYEPGIYVDILSGEPLYSSRDKYDSTTGWPSFTQPITSDALTLHEDRKLFAVRTETRSAIADNHIGHVFNDGPADRGGLRYCMNGAALRFVPEADMVAEGYADFLQYL